MSATWYGVELEKLTKQELIAAVIELGEMIEGLRREHHEDMDFMSSVIRSKHNA